MFHISLKSLSRSEKPHKENGDSFFVKHEGDYCIAGVFDGATCLKATPETRKLPNTPPAFASHLAARICTGALLQKSPHDALCEANEKLKAAAIAYQLDIHNPLTLPKATATIVKINKKTVLLEWAHIGDSILVIAERNGKVQKLSRNQNYWEGVAIETIKNLAHQNNITPKEATKSKEVIALIEKTQQDINMPNFRERMGALDGEDTERVMPFIESGNLTLSARADVFLLSDGAVPPEWNDLETEEAHIAFVTLVKQKGLYGLYRFVRHEENKDSEHVCYPRYKTHDDFTIIWIKAIPY